jgi:hypothetical protein
MWICNSTALGTFGMIPLRSTRSLAIAVSVRSRAARKVRILPSAPKAQVWVDIVHDMRASLSDGTSFDGS